MFRLLFRLSGIIALAGAFVVLVVDGTRSIAANQILLSRIGEQLEQVLGVKFALFQALVQRQAPPWVWDPVLVQIFGLPSWSVLAIFGILLMLITSKRPVAIGYASR